MTPPKEHKDFGTHADFIGRVQKPAVERSLEIEKALKDAFAKHIKREEVDVVYFKELSVFELAEAIQKYPLILKPLVAACNIAGRAIERDLLIKGVDTYKPRIDSKKANAIAGYIKPFLPVALSVPALSLVDRVAFIDKEIRKGKGQWEKLITEALIKASSKPFKKMKFLSGIDWFELDAAFPTTGVVQYGIDIKRIEARRDIHKRIDEIINKSLKFKQCYPDGKFGTVIYYPFVDEQINVQGRLDSPSISAIVFAGESQTSIENAVKMLWDKIQS